MKTKAILIAVIAATALPAATFAEHQPGHTMRHDNAQSTLHEREQSPFFWRVVRFPFRAAYSVVRAPLIGYETIHGQRTFISKDGFLTTDEARQQELDLRRVPFAGDQPDDD